MPSSGFDHIHDYLMSRLIVKFKTYGSLLVKVSCAVSTSKLVFLTNYLD
jgi:hypothetical protein